MHPRYIYWAILLATCGYALWRGRKDERAIAVVCLMASIVSLLSLSQQPSRYSNIESRLLLVDLVTLALFIMVALQSSRFWPLWVAGLQLTTSMAHLMKAIDLDLLPYAYGAAARFWSYPILFIIVLGTWRGRRRMAREAQQELPT